MTRDEAVIMTKIAWTADNWCSSCSRNLLEQLAEAFPEHADVFLTLTDETTEDRLRAATDAWEDRGCTGQKPGVWNV